jgi:hypothetical protein
MFGFINLHPPTIEVCQSSENVIVIIHYFLKIDSELHSISIGF